MMNLHSDWNIKHINLFIFSNCFHSTLTYIMEHRTWVYIVKENHLIPSYFRWVMNNKDAYQPDYYYEWCLGKDPNDSTEAIIWAKASRKSKSDHIDIR